MKVDARNIEFIVRACAGKLACGSPHLSIRRVCTDSRQVQSEDLFVALSGERFDGHDFLQEAARRGTSAVMVDQQKIPAPPPRCAVIAVDNPRRALGRLAAEYRKQFDLPVIAVAGSNGKTTTKELIASVLRQSLSTLWSEASFNNDIGVPLTLLRLENTHQAAILEAGSNHPGELAPLIRMIAPKYGVLTGIGREHLEFFGDLPGVAEEEGWLAELLPPGGKLLLPGDDPWTPRLIQRTRASIIRVGLSPSNDWRASAIRLDNHGASFRVESPSSSCGGEYHIHLLGKHQVANALFAIALGSELGLDRAAIARGLAECLPPRMRLQLEEHNGVRILDDSYNANVDSVLAALQTLLDLPCKGRRVAVLGDMAELGAQTEAAHEEVGRRTAELGISQLVVVGKMASATSRAARDAGLHRVLEFQDVESAALAVKSFLKPGDIVLLKASRVSRLERVAEVLKSQKS